MGNYRSGRAWRDIILKYMVRNVYTTIFPAEWAPQDAVQIAWPHAESDWKPFLKEAEACFIRIAEAVSARQRLIILAPDTSGARQCCSSFNSEAFSRISFVNLPTNDTWSRDFGGLTVLRDGAINICDFTFNGWGLKHAADRDNLLTRAMFEYGVFAPAAGYCNCRDFVLEGGSVDSDGRGTILTTSACLLSPNRNAGLDRKGIEDKLHACLGAERILWLDHGYLAGDDTDSHIDTLARFCNEETICYVECTDQDDEHYDELLAMKRQLETFRTTDGRPYRLVPLPMAEPVFYKGERLPATYANFLVINGAVLCPTYGNALDIAALDILQSLFPGREIVGIECSILIRQHGSLHCVTMQYSKGTVQ